MRLFLGALFFCLAAAHGTLAATAAPQIALSVPQPVTGKPFAVSVLVEGSDNVSPIPTGNVTIQWGDGTTPSIETLSNSRVTAQHSYAASGVYTIRATYEGDANYISSQTSEALVSLLAPLAPITLNTFGDSITWGKGAGSPSWDYASLVASTEGWTLNNQGVQNYLIQDVCAVINASQPLPASAYNTILDGENDLRYTKSSPTSEAQYVSALTSCAVWLATTQGVNRTRAISGKNQLTGSWSPSSYFVNTGLTSTVAGSTITGSFTGNIFYAQLTSIPDADYSVSISIDDGVPVSFSPPPLAYPGYVTDFAPYSARIPLSGTKNQAHSVKFTCTPGASTPCYVDWFAGNGGLSPLQPPYVWLGTPYDTDLTARTPAQYAQMDADVMALQTQLAADGFNVFLANTAKWFNGITDVACMYDSVHPNDCGHAILASAFMHSINLLLGNVSLVALTGAPNPVTVGGNVSLVASVMAANEVPGGTVGFSSAGQVFASMPLEAGAAAFTVNTSSAPAGNYSLTASYSGSPTLNPATSPVIVATLLPASTTTALAASSLTVSVPGSVTFTATVSRSPGSGTPTGTVSFQSEGFLLGTAKLDTQGMAMLSASSKGIAAGSYAITATYNGDASDSLSNSSPVTVSVATNLFQP